MTPPLKVPQSLRHDHRAGLINLIYNLVHSEQTVRLKLLPRTAA